MLNPKARWSLASCYALCALFLFVTSQPVRAHDHPDSDAQTIRDKFEPAAQFLADIYDRPRRVIYTPYAVSAQNGIVRDFVHVSDGTAVLSRTDLVVDGPLPIVFRRAYHSARTSSSDFGTTGWRLTIDEQITRGKGDRLDYVYGNGRHLELDKRGRIQSAVQAYFSDIDEVRIIDHTKIDVLSRTGLTKSFKRSGDVFRIATVVDKYGNRLDFQYSPRGRLSSVESSMGTWISVARDRLGRVKGVQDSHGRIVRYGYDSDGRLNTVTDAGEQVWEYEYDEAHRIIATMTPNGVVDMEFAYDNSGRVEQSRANGWRSKFEYLGERTVVTDSRSLETTFRAAPSGVTVEVANPLGTTTEVRLARSGLPLALIRNGKPIVQFSSDTNDPIVPRNAQFKSYADGEAYRVQYDSRGRVTQVSSATAGRLLEAEYNDAGLIPARVVHADGSLEAVEFDQRGELRRFAKREGNALTFERNGSLWRIEDSSNRKLELEFDAPGRLVKATTPYEHTLRFGYNNIGLRETTEASYGARVRYQYDASGSLFHSAVSDGNREMPAYTYVLGADQRVEGVSASTGELHDFIYDEKGLLTAVRDPSGEELKFAYDELGRLKQVQEHADDTPLEYEYAPGEPDIVAQLSYRKIPVFNQQRELNDFPSRFDAGLTRIRPAVLGLLTYDELTNELTIAADPARWNPMAYLSRSLAALQIEALLGDQEYGLQAFSTPANRLFVPPEYWSVNCCVCYCEGHNDYNCQEP